MVTAAPDTEVECLALCLRTGDDEELDVAERVGQDWRILHEDSPETSTTPERLRSLFRTRTMEAADRWRVPPIFATGALPPISVVDAGMLIAALRSQDATRLDTALDSVGLDSVPLWLRELDGQVRGQVTVVRHTSGRVDVLVDVLATAAGWVTIRVEDDLILAEIIDDLTLQSLLDAAVTGESWAAMA